MMREMRRLTLLSGFLAVFLLAGCTTWLMKGEPPEVLVTNVTPLEASAFEQRLQVDLRIRNPNDVELAVTGIDFRLDLNGNRLARGLGNKEFVVPRLSDAVTSVETSTSTLQVVRQLLSFSGDQSLTYHVTGVLHTKNGRLPFDNSGVLLEQGAPVNARAPNGNTPLMMAARHGHEDSVALLLAFARRQAPTRPMRALVSTGNLGYALPGSVLAVAIMLAFSWLDRELVIPLSAWLGGAGKPLLLGSLFALLLAYLVRFMAVAYGPLENSLARIRPSLPQAARSLGVGGPALFFRVYLPLLVPGALSAALLVFVDVLKEMPATLLMRPFGWDTLSVRIFEMTSEGEWARAALPALTLVLVGLLPVIGLIRRSARQPGH